VRGLFRTQSGVKLSLYVKGRRREEVCEKRVISLGRFYFYFYFYFFILIFLYQIVIMFKGTKDSCSASYGDKKPISKRLPARFTSS